MAREITLMLASKKEGGMLKGFCILISLHCMNIFSFGMKISALRTLMQKNCKETWSRDISTSYRIQILSSEIVCQILSSEKSKRNQVAAKTLTFLLVQGL